MFADHDLRAVVDRLREARTTGQTALVAIDGLGGAGKSTLADQLRQTLDRAAVVHVDDFYRPIAEAERGQLGAEDGYRRYFDWERLRDDVLVPIGDGLPARYRRYDWATDALAESHQVAAGSVVIVEGVFSTRPELGSYYDATVFVDTPREERLVRMLDRGYGDESWVEHWMAAEDLYMTNVRPMEHVDLVLDGSSS
jgi:uridine kinase